MKHEMRLFIDPALIGAAGSDAGVVNPFLSLHLVSRVTETGQAIFENEPDANVICLCQLDQSAVGHIAVCRRMVAQTTTIVLFGLVDFSALASVTSAFRAVDAPPSSSEPLVIGHGRSRLTLHANGVIELEGDDVTLSSRGRMAVQGAYIDLN